MLSSNPIFVPLKERFLLSHQDSSKLTYHLSFDLSGSNITYSVGDCVGIYPINDPDHVEFLLETLGVNGQKQIIHKKTSQQLTLTDFLKRKANLSKITKKLLELLQLPCAAEQTTIIDLAKENAFKNVNVQAFCDTLLPMLPRFYSIASSQKIVGDELHLTVGLSEFEAKERVRLGICSHYLCNLLKLGDAAAIFHHPAKGFTLPEASFTKPIIMIGPGTGIAPFRGFMQERVFLKARENWLFFGEWSQKHHFYYGPYWENLKKEGFLQLSLAFSRDQESKIYVQHKMEEQAKELFAWLKRGAYLYVCGDANAMAKDVHACLQKIIQREGKMSEQETKYYLKQLKEEGRYLRDVY